MGETMMTIWADRVACSVAFPAHGHAVAEGEEVILQSQSKQATILADPRPQQAVVDRHPSGAAERVDHVLRRAGEQHHHHPLHVVLAEERVVPFGIPADYGPLERYVQHQPGNAGEEAEDR